MFDVLPGHGEMSFARVSCQLSPRYFGRYLRSFSRSKV